MNQELRDLQGAAGASWSEVAGVSTPMSFGNDAAALQAATEGVALYDRSHWGRLKISGDDRLRFLHIRETNIGSN